MTTQSDKSKNHEKLIQRLGSWDEKIWRFTDWYVPEYDKSLEYDYDDEKCINRIMELNEKQCVCGKNDLHRLCPVINEKLDKWAIVGSSCIDLFDSKEMRKACRDYILNKNGVKRCVECKKYMHTNHNNVIHNLCKKRAINRLETSDISNIKNKKLGFGKYKNDTWAEVLEKDKNYIAFVLSENFVINENKRKEIETVRFLMKINE